MTQYQQPYGGQPEPKKSKALMIVLIVLGSVVGLSVCCCGGCVFWLSTLPEGGVRTANNMEQYATDYIADKGLVKSDETLIVYYDVTLDGSSDECYILTDKRLIHHVSGGDISIPLGEITGISHREEFGDLITVEGENSQYISLIIPPMNDGQLFLSALQDQARQNGYGAEEAPDDGLEGE